MDEGFTVYLTSNVAPDTFPTNGPSQFSTLLADEVQLDGNGWEVAVRNIMYPSNVKSVTEDEDKMYISTYRDTYRNILPVPKQAQEAERMLSKRRAMKTKESSKYGNKLLDFMTTFSVTFPTESTDRVKDTLNLVNGSEWKKKGLYSLIYKEGRKKFILNCYQEDMLFTMTREMAQYLGFRHSVFTKGTHWAWSEFNPEKKMPSGKQTFTLTDLQLLISEQHTFTRSISNKGHFSYHAVITNLFAAAKDDDLLYEPRVSIDINPSSGKISFRSLKDVPKELLPYEHRMMAIAFDKGSQFAFGLQPLYVIQNYKDIDIPVSRDKNKALAVGAIEATIYFIGLRELELGPTDKPLATIPIDSNIPFTRPSDFLPLLNKLSTRYNYSFTFNTTLQRFTASVGEQYFISMSKSLAVILGFENAQGRLTTFEPHTETVATQFPVLNRAITTLYIYSNIVDNVYIGDVKAPLLLTCPFKRDEKNNVSQVEFLQPIYTKLNRNQVQQIDISIHDEAGSLIPFLYGKTVLTLHFRKRSNFI